MPLLLLLALLPPPISNEEVCRSASHACLPIKLGQKVQKWSTTHGPIQWLSKRPPTTRTLDATQPQRKCSHAATRT